MANPVDMQRCIKDCLDCQAACLRTLTHCLTVGGKHAAPDHIQLLLDCAEICQTSANFMLRGSPLHGRLCAVCAGVCEACAVDCEQFPDDQEMQSCAELCHACASSCYTMSQMLA